MSLIDVKTNGILLPFPPIDKRPVRVESAGRPVAPGAVLLFTGVRYSREGDDHPRSATHGAKKAGGRTKRTRT